MNKQASFFENQKNHSASCCELCILFVLSCTLLLTGCTPSSVNNIEPESQTETIVPEQTEQAYVFDGINNTSMFDGENLGLWEPSSFFEGIYEPGRVYVEDGCIIMEKNDWMTGVTWTGPYQNTNYEMYFEAMRVEGNDFFCTLTFPVDEVSCSLVLGGWGNTISGISNISHRSANENETTLMTYLENNRWYQIYLVVMQNTVQAWLDDELIVELDTTGKIIDVRMECEPSMPLGFATYMTTGAIRNIHYRAF